MIISTCSWKNETVGVFLTRNGLEIDHVQQTCLTNEWDACDL